MQEIRTLQQGAKGIAMGKAFLVKAPDLQAEQRKIGREEMQKEKQTFFQAAEKTKEVLRPLARENEIFAAHLDMAEDETLA